jgi:cysteinyl-tRNA synthetase
MAAISALLGMLQAYLKFNMDFPPSLSYPVLAEIPITALDFYKQLDHKNLIIQGWASRVIAYRTRQRELGNYATADELRALLESKSVTVIDRADNTTDWFL